MSAAEEFIRDNEFLDHNEDVKLSKPIMTPEQKRVAIAEYCGWKDLHAEDGSVWGKSPKDLAYKGNRGMAILSYEVPDYLNSLDAMHEAEKVLNFNQKRSYYIELCKQITPLETVDSILYGFSTCHATSQQRTDAFLLTVGKEL